MAQALLFAGPALAALVLLAGLILVLLLLVALRVVLLLLVPLRVLFIRHLEVLQSCEGFCTDKCPSPTKTTGDSHCGSGFR